MTQRDRYCYDSASLPSLYFQFSTNGCGPGKWVLQCHADDTYVLHKNQRSDYEIIEATYMVI